MEVVVFVGVGIFILFAFVLLFGAPYLPTLSRQAESALDLLDLKPGQTLLELGSGDGKMLVHAARRGIYCVGYELNPILVGIAKLRCWRYRSLVEVHLANFWTVDWPAADAVYVFLLDRFMERLDKKMTVYANNRSVKLASFAFEIKGKKPVVQLNAISLYQYGDKVQK